jgi:hypothetical protein
VLPLRFAGQTGTDALRLVSRSPKPTWQALPWELGLGYLCKLKGTLRPEQMTSDLVLGPASDNRVYRERVLRW